MTRWKNTMGFMGTGGGGGKWLQNTTYGMMTNFFVVIFVEVFCDLRGFRGSGTQ